jgi:hypothetical protein
MMGRRSKLYVDIDEDDIQRSNITDEVIPGNTGQIICPF